MSPALYPQVSNLLSLKPLISSSDLSEIPNHFIHYDTSTVLNSVDKYADRNTYISACAAVNAHLSEEIQIISTLNSDVLNPGAEFTSMLYTYRSTAKPLPLVQGDEDENIKHEIHTKTFAILLPQIEKLTHLRKFTEKAIKLIIKACELMIKIDKEKSLIISEELSLMIIRCINVLIILDALKDMKACLLNDFSRYKRSFTSLRNELTDSEMISAEIVELQMFLSNPSQPHGLIMSRLREDMLKLTQHDVCLAQLITFASESFENQNSQPLTMSPNEKYLFPRVLLLLLYIYDGDTKSTINVFNNTNKSIDMKRITRQFRSLPIIPLYNDLHLDVFFILKRFKNWPTNPHDKNNKTTEESIKRDWQTARPEKIKQRYLLSNYIQRIRREFAESSTQIAEMVNYLKDLRSNSQSIPLKVYQSVFQNLSTILQYLSNWTALIQQQCAYKYANPIPNLDYQNILKNESIAIANQGSEYEKAVRFNYTNEDKHILIDAISMIKSLSNILLENQFLFEPILHTHIYLSTQQFLHSECVKALKRFFKKNKSGMTKNIIILIREIAADFTTNPSSKDEWQVKTKNENEEINIEIGKSFPLRNVTLSPSQIALVRRLMLCVFSPNAPGMQGGFLTDKDLKKEWIPIWNEFYNASRLFAPILSFGAAVSECSDLGFLWYREFYLEITKCVQFPIEMSLPWLLIDFIIRGKTQKENIFFPLSIYNDAAHSALMVHKQQFLFDECEAELNLSFQQFLFHLSEDLFKYYKTLATSILLNKTYQRKIHLYAQMKLQQANSSATDIKLPTIIESRYKQILQQRCITLLTQRVDVVRLISHQVNEYCRRNLDYVLKRFESQDLCSMTEFQSLIENCRLTHQLLVNECDLSLDEFDDLLNEQNENTYISAFKSRILSHLFGELLTDFFPHFVYNSNSLRFVRAKMTYNESINERSKFSTNSVSNYFWYGTNKYLSFAAEKLNSMQKQYFGIEHCESLFQILSSAEILFLFNELSNHLCDQLQYDVAPYIGALIDGLPKMQFPKNTYGIVGAFGLIDVKLRTSIGTYPPLRTNVFQLLREMGNALAFIQLADITRQMNNNRFAPLINSLNPIESQQNNTSKTSLLHAIKDMAPSSISTQSIDGSLTDLIASGVEQSFALHESFVSNSFIAEALNRLYSLIEEKFLSGWRGPPLSADSHNILDHENSRDLCRLLSCLSFIYCTPNDSTSSTDSFSDPQVFGDGYILSVSLLLHLTGSYQRYLLTDLSQIVVKINQMQPIDRSKHSEMIRNSLIQTSGSKNAKKSPTATVEEQEVMILKFLTNVRLYKEKLGLFISQLSSYIESPSKQPIIEVIPPKTEEELRAVSGHSTTQTSQLGRGSLFGGGLSPTIAQSSNQQLTHSRNKSNSISSVLSPTSP